MSKRVGLSPELHRELRMFPDVTKGGTFDITIRLTTENGAFWVNYEGRSSIVTVPDVKTAIEFLIKLCRRHKLSNQVTTRTLLRDLQQTLQDCECQSHQVPSSSHFMQLRFA